MSTANDLAAEIINAAAKAAQQASLVLQVADVTQVNPLLLELHGSDITLGEEELAISQENKRYTADDGMSVGDTVLIAKHMEEWRVFGVFSDTKTPTTIASGGGGGSATTHEYIQAVLANPWVVSHGLGRYPVGVEVYDTLGNLLEADIEQTDANTMTISFNWPLSGRVVYV